MYPRDVYELFKRAREALDMQVPCRTTAKSYWLNGKQAVNDMIRSQSDADDSRYLESVRDYVEQHVAHLSLDDDIDYQCDFWEGFKDGVEGGITLDDRTKAYEEGFFAAQKGA